MGFKVDYAALKTLHDGISIQTDNWQSRLDALKSAFDSIAGSSNLKGVGASNVKQYCGMVHGEIIDSIKSLISLHADNYLLYKYDYRNSIDSNANTVISESELETVSDTLDENNKTAIKVNDEVEAALSEVRDIFRWSFRDVADVDAAHRAVTEHIADVTERVKNLETQHESADFTNTTSLISSLNAFISEMTGKARSYKEGFSEDGLIESDAYKALKDAIIAVEKEREEKADSIETTKQDKDEVIRKYEEKDAELAEKLDDLLEKLSDEDVREIKYLIYTSEEPYRSIYLNELESYTIGNISGDDTGYFTDFFNTINVDMIMEPSNPRGPYTTFFHESGHAIDYNFKNDGKYYSRTYRNSDGLSLQEAIFNDVRSEVTKRVNKEKSLTPDQQQHIIDYIMGGNPRKVTKLSAEEQEALNRVVSYYKYAFQGPEYEAVCDVYGGATNLIIDSYGYGHRPPNSSKYYWYDIFGNPTEAQSTELWAEYYSYNMANDEQALEYLREYFPTASELLDEMAASMGG